MRTWLRIALVGLALVVVSEGAVAITVRGASNCGKWIKDREAQKQGALTANDAWIVGYLSGLAIASRREFWAKGGVEQLGAESVFLWVDNYCRANPQKGIGEAGLALFNERTRNKARGMHRQTRAG